MRSSIDQNKITAMREGGHRLAQVRDTLKEFTHAGSTFEEIEAEAQRLIKAAGAKPNFAMVPGYHWATCLMLNDALCHGIPQGKVVADGDIMTIDIGLFFQGYHLDTTVTFPVGEVPTPTKHFLDVGRQSLKKAIEVVHAGQSVYEVSKAMQKTVEKHGYGAVYQLTGHGISRELHEDPAIPCVAYPADKRVFLEEGQTIAVEIMYTAGSPDLVVDDDGWTYRTVDGSLSGMFEETLLVTKSGAEILTQV